MNEADRKILPLLSGWLDGELTPEEKQRVDKALQRSAALRAVVEEWRSVDQTIHEQVPERSEAAWEALALRVEGAVAEASRSEDAAPLKDSGQARSSHGSRWLERLQAWFAPRRWVVGSTGALAAIVLLVLLWPHSDQWLGTSGVLRDEVKPILEHPEARKPAAAAKDPEPASPGSAPARSEEAKKDEVARSTAEKDLTALRESEAESPAVGRTLNVRGGRSEEASAQIEGAGESQMGLSTRPDDDRQPRPEVMFSSPAPPVAQQRLVLKKQASSAEVDWLAQTNLRLDAALAAESRDALRNVVSDIDRHRVESPAEALDVAFLRLAVRARGEFLKRFPEALDNHSACAALHADYQAFLALADQATRESPQNLPIGDLVDEVCPD